MTFSLSSNTRIALLSFGFRDQKRLPTETRGKNYLREEFRKRLYEGSVKYKLQLTFHVPRSDDPAAILNVARYWDEATHPWLDVADVTINVFLSPDVTEKMRFNPGNLAPCLGLLPACSIHDSNCVVHIRKEVYERTQKLRALRDGSNYAPDQTAIYSISVQTANHKKARTDARIFLSLTGKIVLLFLYIKSLFVKNDRRNSYITRFDRVQLHIVKPIS